MLDHETLTKLIQDARERNVSSSELAEEILARAADPSWAKAMGHPTRGKILRLLHDEGPISPVHAARLLHNESLGTIAYHFRRLQVLGLIVEDHRVPRRGAVEHVYRLTSVNGRA